MAKLETHHAVRDGQPTLPPGGKEWSWSYSKLKNFEECPKRMYEVDIAKSVQDGGGEALLWGNAVHDALAAALKSNVPLPPEMLGYQYWVDRVRRGTGTLQVEQKYAITRQFQKTGYFAKDVWYRGIGDVIRLNDDVALILDWKTGKILEDSVQLMLMAQCLFSHYPQLNYVRSSYVWLKEDCETPELFTRQEVADQWVGLLDRVNGMERAAKEMNYPPKPGRLCKRFCPVVSCPFHGKGAR
jgi:hypothetical protein